MTSDPKKTRPDDKESRLRWLFGALGLLSLGALLGRILGRTASATSAPPVPENTRPSAEPNRGHESRDANAKWIFGIVVGLFVFGLGIHGILAWFLSALKHSPPPTDAWQPVPGVSQPRPARPPFPMLQVSPAMDLHEFRAAEDGELTNYGWINRTAGIVRLPIERAMDLALRQGFPTRQGTNQIQLGPSTYQLMQERPNQRQPEIQGER